MSRKEGRNNIKAGGNEGWKDIKRRKEERKEKMKDAKKEGMISKIKVKKEG